MKQDEQIKAAWPVRTPKDTKNKEKKEENREQYLYHKIPIDYVRFCKILQLALQHDIQTFPRSICTCTS